MRYLYLLLPTLLLAMPADAAQCSSLLTHKVDNILGEKEDLCQYAGKVVLVVNTASFCGYTPQYKGLQALNEKYKSRGLVNLGFPSNDFGQQEPGSNKEIARFCEANYGVSFPMFTKTNVSKGAVNPFYEKLAASSGTRPGWNFHKYLVDRKGAKALSFDTRVEPGDPKLVKEIERLLAEKGDSK